MTDFRTWVVGQSAKLGYDFNALTKEDQENIISALLSYAEDAFRSQCDYPDMRFGKRRGIYKKSLNSPINYRESEDTPPSCGSDAMSSSCPPIDTTGTCGDVVSCPIDSVNPCPADMFYPCTNSICNNQPNVNCTDTGCINVNECKDEVTASSTCSDNGCINMGNCTDSRTGGTSSCSDVNCTNKHGGVGLSTCKDTQECVDTSCTNTSNCLDIGNSSTKTCTDSFCINSKAVFGDMCGDQICKDNGCLNIFDSQCTDTLTSSIQCIDSSCANWGTLNSSCANSNNNSCTDSPCTNNPFCNDNPSIPKTCSDSCIDLGGSTCQDGCSDKNFAEGICIDNEIYCANNGNNCIDQDCTDDEGCSNMSNCSDVGTEGHSCTDNKCKNESSAVCSDRGNCSDIECINSANCVDDEGCQDGSCSNTVRCSDFNNSSSSCGNQNSTDGGHCQSYTKDTGSTCLDAAC